MRRASGRIDDPRCRIGWPTKRSSRSNRVQHRLRQRDLSTKRRMHRILEQFVVEQAVAADVVEVRLTVDEDAVVPRGHLTVDLLERR